MNNTFLVADSGGSKTDWCFVDQQNERQFFTTQSFHPSQWGNSFFEELAKFWETKRELKESQLYFYGAGCLNESNKKVISDYFSKWGFKYVRIFSDLEGACHSLLGNRSGTVAILGTGSVLCHFDGQKISEIKGGLGYLLGDEGGGYYFGKLLISKYLMGQFSEETMITLSKLLGNRSEILNHVYGNNGKSYLSSLSFLTKGLKETNFEVLSIHEENLRLFVDGCFSVFYRKEKELFIVGSYGFFNQEIVNKILEKHNIKLTKSVQYPIKFLTDYVLKNTDESMKRSF